MIIPNVLFLSSNSFTNSIILKVRYSLVESTKYLMKSISIFISSFNLVLNMTILFSFIARLFFCNLIGLNKAKKTP